MSLPRLPLSPPAPPPTAAYFRGTSPILWVGAPDLLSALHRDLGLQDRIWTLPVSPVAVPGPPPGTNPFSHRPDRQAPLRWGTPSDDVRTLGEAGAPDLFGGAVFAGALGPLGGQAARTLLTQAAEHLPSGAPWLVIDRNGRYAPEVVRNLRRPDSERGEGKGTVRTVEELRRLLEPAGFGISSAHALGGRRRDRLLQRAFGSDAASMWFVLTGERL
jgi:hypothetical protein